MVRSYRSRTSSVPSVTHYTLRKRRCGEPTSLYITQHTYAFQSIQSIVASRPNYDNDVSDLSVDDARNGVLVMPLIHTGLGLLKIAFLKV